MKKTVKKYGKVVRNCAIGVGCIALALWIFDIGGIGSGVGLPRPWVDATEGNNGDGEGGGYAEQPHEATPPQDPTNNDGGQNDVLLVRVVGNSIYHGYEEIDIDVLANLLQNANPNLTWELRDEQAILGTLDVTRAVFLENGIEFTQTSRN